MIENNNKNNIFVYCEIEEDSKIADVSFELLSKAKKLATELKCGVEAIIIGAELGTIETEIYKFGVDIVHKADDKRLFPYTTIPHAEIVKTIIKEREPQIVLIGATSIGRDLSPRVASSLKCGLTADCTDLVIGEYSENRTKKVYKDLLYQIRPAFGGNIIATIVNPETKPQMATVREGVMKMEVFEDNYSGEMRSVDVTSILNDTDFVIKVIERHIEERKVNLGAAQIIIAGGFGVGSKENFDLLFDLGKVIGGDVGASRAAVDAGFVSHDRQIGQTGVTVRPKLYIAAGISGAVQHRAGMEESSQIISINTDPDAPINSLADFTIIGDVSEVIPRMIKGYREVSK